MTKVLMNINLLAYRQYMKEKLRQVLQYNHVAGVEQVERVATPLDREHLLPPACIIAIDLWGYSGQSDDCIGIVAYHDFGIHAMHITILDEQGNAIESGEAEPFPDTQDLWDYLPEVCVAPGSVVIIQAVVMDCMGGIAIQRESKRVP